MTSRFIILLVLTISACVHIPGGRQSIDPNRDHDLEQTHSQCNGPDCRKDHDPNE